MRVSRLVVQQSVQGRAVALGQGDPQCLSGRFQRADIRSATLRQRIRYQRSGGNSCAESNESIPP